ncbi:MAG: hypothetical protein L0Z71_17785 [Anaerolineae bacterium]|nr:hypothetical protein [Anaerolineae bacterium]
MKFRIPIFILIIVLLSACGGQPTEIPTSTSQPTEEIVSAISSPVGTETSTSLPLPTDTAAPTDTAQATEPAAATQPAATVSFANDVFPIIQSRCINCHGGDRTEEGLVMLTYAELMAGSDNGPVITAGDAENSLLAELVSTQKMPKRGPKLTPPQVQVIIDWISQGALNN